MKTGALIQFGCEAGARLGRATPGEREALVRYGDHLGFAFQISDDLLDATGTTEAVGKAVAKDAAAGKATLVSLMGIEPARAKLAEVEQAAIAALDPFGERAIVLAEAVRYMGRRQT
jgi:farnesyl diphosphate synthase